MMHQFQKVMLSVQPHTVMQTSSMIWLWGHLLLGFYIIQPNANRVVF